MSKKYSLPTSFGFAIDGLKTALKKEPNFRTHTLFAITTLGLAIILKFSFWEWIVLLFAISFVIVLELFNTAIESIVNLVSPEIKKEARVAKDVSAAAVLLAAFVATIVGLLLFIPKLLTTEIPVV